MMSSLHGSTGRWRRRVVRREEDSRRGDPHLVLRSRGRGRGDQHASRRGWAAECPLLTLVLSPAAADATSALALLPAYPTAVWRTRRELAGVRRRWLWLLLATSVVGGLAGALMLVRTDDRNFVFLMPWLVLGRSRSARSLRRDTFCSSP